MKTVKSKPIEGRLYILLEKYNFTPGEQVNGTIELDIEKEYPPGEVTMSIVCLEKVQWWSESQTSRKKSTNLYKVHKDNFKAFEYKYTISNFSKNKSNKLQSDFFPILSNCDIKSNQNIDKGSYRIPFSFVLPDEISSSFSYDWDEFRRPCFAKIQFYIKASCSSYEMAPEYALSNYRNFLVYQPNDGKVATRRLKIRHTLKTCGCNRGKIIIHSKMDKPEYDINDTMKMIVEVENNAFKSIKRFEVGLVQVLYMRSMQSSTVKKNVISVKFYDGIKHKKKKIGENAMIFEVNPVSDPQEPNASGFQTVFNSKNHITAHGVLMDCDYYINVTCIPTVLCTCCLCFHADPIFSNPIYLYNSTPVKENKTRILELEKNLKVLDLYVAQ